LPGLIESGDRVQELAAMPDHLDPEILEVVPG
jgi:hypothetical protein